MDIIYQFQDKFFQHPLCKHTSSRPIKSFSYSPEEGARFALLLRLNKALQRGTHSLPF